MKNKKGFSIIEIIVVLLILGIVAAISIPAISSFYGDSEEEIYLAEGEKVLTSCQVEAQKFFSKHNFVLDENLVNMKKSILKRASLAGEIVYIHSDNTNSDVGYFCYQVEDGSCYVIYDDYDLTISKVAKDKNQ